MKVKAARSDKGWLDRKLASLKLRKGFEEESQKLAVGEHRDYASYPPPRRYKMLSRTATRPCGLTHRRSREGLPL
jgi:hypothetical protein